MHLTSSKDELPPIKEVLHKKTENDGCLLNNGTQHYSLWCSSFIMLI